MLDRGCRVWLVMLVAFVASLSTGAGPSVAAQPSPCRIRYPSDGRVEWTCRQLGNGETLESVFGDRWVDVARYNRIDRRHAVRGVGLKVPAHLDGIRRFTPMPSEVREAASERKFLFVDLSEQFLGAYEFGRLAFSAPVTVGEQDNATPTGNFRLEAAHRAHTSSLYSVNSTGIPYPMTWALRFFVTRGGIGFWIHGRDVPGYPASHGCIGLYDETMQRAFYGVPGNPVLDDARILYEWIVGPAFDDSGLQVLKTGPRIRIIGRAPDIS